MSEEQLNEMLENIENAMWQIKNCKCNVDVTSKGHKWETYYGLDNDLINYIRKIEKELQQKENIIREVREYIENNTYKTEWGDLEQDNEDINISEDLTEKEFIEELLEILKGSDEISK